MPQVGRRTGTAVAVGLLPVAGTAVSVGGAGVAVGVGRGVAGCGEGMMAGVGTAATAVEAGGKCNGSVSICANSRAMTTVSTTPAVMMR